MTWKENQNKNLKERNDCAGLPNYLGPDGAAVIRTPVKRMPNCHHSVLILLVCSNDVTGNLINHAILLSPNMLISLSIDYFLRKEEDRIKDINQGGIYVNSPSNTAERFICLFLKRVVGSKNLKAINTSMIRKTMAYFLIMLSTSDLFCRDG